MYIQLLRSYPKLEDGKRKLDKQGNAIIVFVYKVTGKKEDLEKYVKIQEAAGVKTIKDDDGTVLWFTTNPVGLKGRLAISVNDKIYADTTSIDLANSLMKSHGAAGTLMAKQIMAEGVVSDQVSDPVHVDPDLNDID